MARPYQMLNNQGSLDLAVPGAFGVNSDIANLASNTPYMRRPSEVRLTRPPSAFEFHPQGAQLTAWLKQMVETRCNNWSGINPNQDLEQVTVPYGRDRQQLNIPSVVTNQQMSPSSAFNPVYNAADIKLWRYLVRILYGDAKMGTPAWAEYSQIPTDWGIDRFTFDLIAWEPNQTGTAPVTAVAIGAMSMSNVPEFILERNSQQANTNEEYTITWNCVWEQSDRIDETALAIIQSENISSINSKYKPSPVATIDPTVAAANGMSQLVTEAKAWG